MGFERSVRLPADRVAALIGRGGRAKARIERACGARVGVDSSTGLAAVSSEDPVAAIKAAEVVSAVARGFSPESALDLLRGDNALHVIPLAGFAGRSRGRMSSIRGRVIGEDGRARRTIEALTGTRVSVYGKTVSIIGSASRLREAAGAVSALCGGSMHGSVYGRLEAARRRERAERAVLWEGGRAPG